MDDALQCPFGPRAPLGRRVPRSSLRGREVSEIARALQGEWLCDAFSEELIQGLACDRLDPPAKEDVAWVAVYAGFIARAFAFKLLISFVQPRSGVTLLAGLIIETFPRRQAAAVREQLAEARSADADLFGNALVEGDGAGLEKLVREECGADGLRDAGQIEARKRADRCNRRIVEHRGRAHLNRVRALTVVAGDELQTATRALVQHLTECGDEAAWGDAHAGEVP